MRDDRYDPAHPRHEELGLPCCLYGEHKKLAPGASVKWSRKALAARDPFDRPYAEKSRGTVIAICNGGFAVRVLWPFGERVHEPEALVVTEEAR